MIELSIIIPTHNNELYIKRCIESIKYKNKNIEIIVVNDGSTDKTKQIIEEEPNIKVINLKNQKGVSFARNIGIKESRGKYFTFIDGDDYICNYDFNLILKDITKYNPDIIIYNYYEENKIRIKSKYQYQHEILNNKQTINKLLNDQISQTVWAKIYNKKFKNIKFNEQLKINEDCEYTLNVLSKSQKTLIKKDFIYVYNKNNNSLTSKYTCEQIKNNDYIKYISKDIKKNPSYSIYREIHELKKLHLYSQCKKNRYKYLKKNIDKNLLRKLLKESIPISNKIEIIIYLTSIRTHIILFKYYLKIRKIKRR